MLEESAVINETYDFLTEVTLGSLSTVQFLPEIVTTDVMSSVVRLQHISLPMSVAVISLCSFWAGGFRRRVNKKNVNITQKKITVSNRWEIICFLSVCLVIRKFYQIVLIISIICLQLLSTRKILFVDGWNFITLAMY